MTLLRFQFLSKWLYESELHAALLSRFTNKSIVDVPGLSLNFCQIKDDVFNFNYQNLVISFLLSNLNLLFW